MNTFEVYYSDLNEEAQNEILKAFGVESPSEMNWDLLPIAEIVICED